MRNIEQVMQMRSVRNKPPIQFQQTFSHPKWMYEQKKTAVYRHVVVAVCIFTCWLC